MSEIEQILLQHTRDRAAAGNIRGVASRTRDVIDAVVHVALLDGRTPQPELNSDDLGLQLELGLPTQLVPLARVVGNSLNRGDYLTLLGAGITEPGQVIGHGIENVTSLLGEDVATTEPDDRGRRLRVRGHLKAEPDPKVIAEVIVALAMQLGQRDLIPARCGMAKTVARLTSKASARALAVSPA